MTSQNDVLLTVRSVWFSTGGQLALATIEKVFYSHYLSGSHNKMIFNSQRTAAKRTVSPAVHDLPGFMLNASEHNLLKRIAEHDRGAIRECLDRYGSLVWAFAKRRSRDVAAAERLTFEIFTELWRCAASYDPKFCTEKTFILSLAHSYHKDLRQAPVQ